MKVYAERPHRATGQLSGDLLVLLWVLFWVYAGTRVHERVSALAEPGREAEQAGRDLQRGLSDAAGSVDDVPVAGDALREPFDQGAGAGRGLADAARDYQEAVADLALLATVLTAAVPIVLVLARWLPRRIAWAREASAAARLLRSDGPAALDLFALRALAQQPLPQLAGVAPDPAAGWRAQDPAVTRDLARLELHRLGLRAPPQ